MLAGGLGDSHNNRQSKEGTDRGGRTLSEKGQRRRDNEEEEKGGFGANKKPMLRLMFGDEHYLRM
jgi:hypothetical protein